MPARRSSRGSARRPATYAWRGIQFPLTILAATATSFNMVDSFDVDEMGGATMVRVRGNLVLRQNTATATNWALKMFMDNTDDAGAITSDISPLDTDAEDISFRQLWTKVGHEPTIGGLADSKRIEFEIDVKAKIKLRAKQGIFLIGQSDGADMSIAGYLRCLLIT